MGFIETTDYSSPDESPMSGNGNKGMKRPNQQNSNGRPDANARLASFVWKIVRRWLAQRQVWKTQMPEIMDETMEMKGSEEEGMPGNNSEALTSGNIKTKWIKCQLNPIMEHLASIDSSWWKFFPKVLRMTFRTRRQRNGKMTTTGTTNGNVR